MKKRMAIVAIIIAMAFVQTGFTATVAHAEGASPTLDELLAQRDEIDLLDTV